MLAYGASKRLSIPTTPEDTLRDLLGDILTPEREEQMRAKGRIEVPYEAAALGTFQVTLSAREGASTSSFSAGAGESAAPPVPHPAPAAIARAADRAHPAPRSSGPPASTRPAPIARPIVEDDGAPSLLSGYVVHAAELRASDLHLADGEPPCVRVDGALHRLDLAAGVDVAATLGLRDVERARLAGGESIDLGPRSPGSDECAFTCSSRPRGWRRRCASSRAAPLRSPRFISRSRWRISAELRTGSCSSAAQLGSGKSTTLAALAQEALRRRSIVLTTLEDPIEFALSPPETSLVRRRQIGRDVRASPPASRGALREDPDVLLLGEMRDKETIALALTAAETGHLVLSSLHSRSAASAIERIVDVFPPEGQAQVRTQLADSLRAVGAQRAPPARAGARGVCPVVGGARG